MNLVARKIQRAKWEREPSFMGVDDVGADAITGCLRTRDHELSLWQCSEDDQSARDVVLALASTRDNVEGVQLVVIPMGEFHSIDVKLRSSKATTPVQDLNDRHVDAVELTQEGITKIATLLVEYIRKGEGYRQYTKVQVLDILKQGVRDGRVDVGGLREGVRDAVH